MKKIISISLICLISLALISQGLAVDLFSYRTDGNEIVAEVEISNLLGEYSVFSVMSDVVIHNHTEMAVSELVAIQHDIVYQIETLYAVAKESIVGVARGGDLELEGLPVVAEVVYIGENVTIILTETAGEPTMVTLIESDISQISVSDLAMDYVMSGETFEFMTADCAGCLLVEANSEVRFGALNSATPGCNGPCSIFIPPGAPFFFNNDTGRNDPIRNGLGVLLPMRRSSAANPPGAMRQQFRVIPSAATTIPPTNSNGNIISGANNFIYGGWVNASLANNARTTADLGLMWQQMAGTTTWSWRPFFSLQYGGQNVSFASGHTPPQVEGQVWGTNGFVPGQPIVITNWIDTLPSGGSRVSSQTTGMAFHQFSNGSGNTRVNLTHTIFHTLRDNNRILPPTEWRLIVHPAIPNIMNDRDSHISRAFITGTFNNISLDGVAPVFGQTTRDFGFAQNQGGGTWFLQSCKGI